MYKVDKKMYRVLLLSAIFFLSGLVFFIRGWSNRVKNDEGIKINMNQSGFGGSATVYPSGPLEFTGWPTADTFPIFSNQNQTFEIKEACIDKYLVILIFEKGVDYRKDPGSAKYNSAYECIDDKVNTKLDLSKIKLNKGGQYYMFFADQGNETWYNPR